VTAGAGVPGERVGITSTVPIEVLLAAGLTPADLNNLFIAGADPEAAVARAEAAGFPRACCAWIKGIYDTALAEGIRRVVVVTGGDCANGPAMAEVWAAAGVEVVPFAYPDGPDAGALAAAVARLAARFGVTAADAEAVYRRLAPVRARLARVDELLWRTGQVTPREAYDRLIGASDFGGAAAAFDARLTAFLLDAERRPGRDAAVRLGLLGVPPITPGLIEACDELGAAVVFHEVPRQFALLGGGADLAAAYTAYTYPYGVGPRLGDIRRAAAERRLAGVIHYVQTFCHRGIHDILLRRGLGLPVLTLEGERPGPLSAQQHLRLETFVEMLRA